MTPAPPATPSTPIRFGPAAPPRPLSVGMAPMVDIVLLLICFYLLVAKNIQDQDDPDVKVPVVTADIARDEMPAEMVINVYQDGRLSLNARPTDLEALEATLATERDAAARRGAALAVVVRADRRQSFGLLDEVMTACRRAGLTQVLLRAATKE